jgi:hypothetical protein
VNGKTQWRKEEEKTSKEKEVRVSKRRMMIL